MTFVSERARNDRFSHEGREAKPQLWALVTFISPSAINPPPGRQDPDPFPAFTRKSLPEKFTYLLS